MHTMTMVPVHLASAIAKRSGKAPKHRVASPATKQAPTTGCAQEGEAPSSTCADMSSVWGLREEGLPSPPKSWDMGSWAGVAVNACPSLELPACPPAVTVKAEPVEATVLDKPFAVAYCGADNPFGGEPGSPLFDSPGYADLDRLPPAVKEELAAPADPHALDDQYMGTEIEWWGSMEPLVTVSAPATRVASTAVVSSVGLDKGGAAEGSISVSLAGRGREIEFAASASPADMRGAVRTAFGLTAGAHFVLRHSDGCVMPVNSKLPVGPFELELVDSTVNPTTTARVPAAILPGSAGSSLPSLEFVQEPPKGSCEWLTVKVTKGGEPKPLAHTFTIEVGAAAGDPKEQRQWLEGAQVRLFNPALEEVTQLLHAGPKTVRMNAAGRLTVCWGQVAITEVSSTQSAGVIGVNLRGANAIKGGRCAQGWYHLCVSAPGAADLWLRSGAAQDPDDLGKIIVKHKRCYATGRWVEKRLGPYADHALCRPAHIASDGKRLCGNGCCLSSRKE